MALQELKQNTDVWVIDAWRYTQLELFVKKLPQPIRSGDDLTALEKLCISDNTKYTISKLYKMLLTGRNRGTYIYQKMGKGIGDTERFKHY